MLLKSIIIYLFFFGILLSQDESDCVFDSKALTDKFLKKNSNFQFFKWDDEKKEAKVITKSGDFIFIKKWACVHRGTLARLIITEPENLLNSDNLNYWFEKLKWLSIQITNYADSQDLAKHLDKVLTKTTLKKQLRIDIPSEIYDEFFVYIDFQDGMVILSLFYIQS